jgi:hypothetical protein
MASESNGLSRCLTTATLAAMLWALAACAPASPDRARVVTATPGPPTLAITPVPVLAAAAEVPPPAETQAPAASATATAEPTATPTPPPTATPAPTERPTQPPTTYYVISPQAANVRANPSTSAEVVAQVSPGAEVQVVGQAVGGVASGSTLWYEVRYAGRTAYIHSSVVSRTRPAPGGPAPTQAAQPAASGAGFTCDCRKSCGAMASCEEAYYQLNVCGCSARDIDKDGVPCESICPGG